MAYYLAVGAGMIFTAFTAGAVSALLGLHWWLP